MAEKFDLFRRTHPDYPDRMFASPKVYEGLVEDRFAPIILKKPEACGSPLVETHILPDDVNCIAAAITASLKRGADFLITTGGMSVDPDDVTRLAISRAGVERLFYGAGALPGPMFLLANKGRVPIMGVTGLRPVS